MILRNDRTLPTLPRFSLSAAALVLGTTVLATSALATETYQPTSAQNKTQDSAQGTAMGTSTLDNQTSSTQQSGQQIGQQSGQQAGKSQQSGGMQQAGNQSGKSITERLPDRYQLSTWMDKTVKNSQGEKLGTVEELVMDDVGRLRYVILKSDQLTDNKDGNLVAVPAGHFQYPLARKDHLVLEASSQQMQDAPKFSENRDMPNVGRPEISSVIIAYWVPEEGAGGNQGGQTAGQSAGQTAGQSGSGQNQQQTAANEYGYDGNRDIIKLSDRKSELFNELDKNDSGAIERSEAEGHEELSQRFSEADTYGNEAITRSEFAAFELKDDKSDASNKLGQSRSTDNSKPEGDSSMR